MQSWAHKASLKCPESRRAPHSASLLCVFLPTIQLGPATGPALGKYFYSFSLIAFERRRARWVWEVGGGKKICVCKGGENRDGWRDLSLASAVQDSKGSLCEYSASTLKLEWVWRASVLDLREEGDLGRQHMMVWAQPVSFFFFFFLLVGDIS